MSFWNKRTTIDDIENLNLNEAELSLIEAEETLIRAKLEFDYQTERVKRVERSIATRNAKRLTNFKD